MATILPVRPSTNGTTGSGYGLDRKTSLSSFPASRASSNHSIGNGASRGQTRAAARRNGSNSSTQSVPTPASNPEPTRGLASRSTRKLKPQYPAESLERHVEYILVATFDIDRGPIMEYQYPGAISGDEGMLAELMLPDQAHVRNQDWTIFFLHKDTGDEEAEAQARRLRKERRERVKEAAEDDNVEGGTPEEIPGDDLGADDPEEEEEEGREGPPLIYVLNLVNTKQDSTVKRGAVVRAMAICTRHSFLHIYKVLLSEDLPHAAADALKPLLLLALEGYFKSPYPETLAMLYDAVNAMDLSLLPRLSTLERYILQSSDTKDMFIEKFDQMIQQQTTSEAELDNPTSPDSPPKNGNEPVRPPRHALPRDTHEYETRVVYNGIPIPIKIPTAACFETVGDFSCIKLIQTFSAPHATSPQPFALHPHLTTCGAYTHPIIVLVNAMLTQKRVIFLGHNRPSGEVAEAVLAACTLVSGGVLRGFTRHAFPYTDLSKIDDLLNVPGFIAGVTNPTFANHPEWWDLLCDIPTGRMKISNRIEQAPITDGFFNFQQQNPSYAPNNSGVGGGTQPANGTNDPTGDVAFMDDIIRSIASRHGESFIRSKWRDYITKFTRVAAAFEESVYGASALYPGAQEADAGAYGVSGHGYVWPDETSRGRELGANVWRIEGWRNTRSYSSLKQDLAAVWCRLPIRKLDLGHQIDRLRQLKLSHDDSGRIFLALKDAIRSYDEVCQLLTATPENHAGLFYLSLGLFHPDGAVRWGTVELLERIKEHEAGRHFWSQLGRFAKCAFARIKREGVAQMRDGLGTGEDVDGGMGEEWEGWSRTGTGRRGR